MERRNRRLMLVVCLSIAALGGDSRVSAQGTAVPSPWASQDIGSPAIAGASSFDQASGTFSIDAAGRDIWGTADQFHFIYQPLAGDAVITARVDTLAAAHAWSKAGVMIRSSLNADAAHAIALVSAANGAAFQRRRSNGGLSTHTSGSNTAAAPLWVRLVRSGATVTASMSSNGTSWTTIGSDTIALGATVYVGLAVTSHNAEQSTSADVSSVTVTGTAVLPSPQQSQDIGSPAIAGAAAFSQGTYTVTAAGRDIWDTADQFHYVYQPLTGDMDVSVRVVSLTGSTPQAKAGVMIRENLTPGSAQALAALSSDSGYLFQRRPTAGGTSLQSIPVAGTTPGWVRLKRTGDLITAYSSLDGTTWTPIGSDSFPMVDTVYVGIAVTSRSVSAATTATLTNLVVDQSQPANQPPTATLSAPANGASFVAPATISLTASASDPDGSVARVDFYSGSTLLGSDPTAPYAFNWSNVAAGTYSLRATAVDNTGATGSSATATITVTAALNQAPTAALTAPVNGASVTAPATISLTATASDSNGTVARVDFYNGTTLLGTDASAPYAFTWSNVAAGTYALKATAVDNVGASGSSATATITVTAGASGLVAAYGLNEGTGTTVNDNSGNGQTGTMSGATWVAGRYGQALDLNGASSVVTVSDLDLTGSFTVMGWMQTRSLYSTTCASFVMKAFDYGFEVCNGNLLARIGSGNGWNTYAIRALSAADLNVWKHLAMTYDGTTVRMYIDGVLIDSATGAHVSNDNPLLFGRWTPASEYWDGAVDEVRIYNRSLSQGEVQADLATPVSGSPANQAPIATLTAPADSATFTAPASITLTATASDADGSVARVDFYNGTTLLGSDTTAPYAFTWSNVAAGTYSLGATAVDNAGATGSSATATVTVTAPANQIPTATLTAPANGASFTAPATISLTASASDSDGTVARVEFYNGSTLLGSDTTAPYAFTWSNVAAGTYALRATAVDDTGATGSSATATVTVTAATNQIPTATLTSPANGASFVAPATISLTASASDPDGSVARVDFYSGSTLLGSDPTAPYAFTWSNVAAGTYTLRATAVDNTGATGSSATATITVTAALNQAPTATLTAPANGAGFTAPATISLTATASDPNGTVARVDFYNGTTLLGTDASAPYAFTWSNVSAGTYALKATAVDNVGASGSSATATITVTAAASGLVAAYGLNEGTGTTVNDNSGNGQTGTMSGATWIAGRYGQALNLNGADSVVTVSDLDLPGSFTVMGWMQTRSLYSTTCASFVMKAFDYGFEVCNGILRARIGSGTGWNTYAKKTLTTADLNVWQHLAMTYDGTTVRMYINGVLIDSATGAHVSNDNPLLFGRWTPASEYWNGAVDEVRIYSRTLSLGEVQTDMATPVSGGAANEAPIATLTAPANGATFTAPASINLTATASDADGSVARVDFYNGTTLLGSDTTAPYAFTWSNVATGTYALRATAVDNAGASGSSSVASVTVNGANQPPTATLTAPADGATFTAPASITLTAAASDADGSVARVDFYNGTTLLGSDTTAPYAFTWSNVAAGTYALRATAVDNAGASGSSATATVTVTAAANQPPTATLTSPANGATFTAPASITLTATASDADGSVARVDFYNGTTLLGSDTTAPYAFTWSNVAAGTYALRATAVDNAGASGSSTTASVTVNAANQPPTVTLTAPANGATFTAPATISLTASASDADGTVARVDFYNGTTLLGTDTTAPYAFAWSGVGAGTYALRAIAYDNVGASTTSATATITVATVTTPPTGVMFQASTEHAIVTSYLLEIFANGADPNVATPVATSDLGKPTPAANGDISVNRATLFSGLAPGTYLFTVSSIGPGGSTRSVSLAFTR